MHMRICDFVRLSVTFHSKINQEKLHFSDETDFYLSSITDS